MEINPYYATVCNGAIQVIGAGFGAFLINKWGRKSLLVTSEIVCFLANMALGTCFHYTNDDEELSRISPWFTLVFVFVFTFGYTVGFATVPWVLIGELLPAHSGPIGTGKEPTSLGTKGVLRNSEIPRFGLHSERQYGHQTPC